MEVQCKYTDYNKFVNPAMRERVSRSKRTINLLPITGFDGFSEMRRETQKQTDHVYVTGKTDYARAKFKWDYIPPLHISIFKVLI